MMTFDERFLHYRTLTERALEQYLPESESVLNASMRYSLLAGGKRLRPVLALAWCELCGSDAGSALPAAAALEMIHTYSLIHDDLPCMDDDTLRRGRPTNHVVYGEAIALLAGSGLYNTALETVLRYGPEQGLSSQQVLDSLSSLCSAAGTEGILTGQTLDITNDAGASVDRAYLEQVNDLKTAALLRASCRLGAIAANAPESVRDTADRFGRILGQAFQIRDDILDVVSSPEVLGKTPGKDEREHKTTFVTILGMQGAQQEVRRLTDEALALLDAFPNSEFLRELTERMCGREA